MATIPLIFRCPNTDQRVQALVGEEAVKAAGKGHDVFETISCIACGRVHIVNLRTGGVIGGWKRPS